MCRNLQDEVNAVENKRSLHVYKLPPGSGTHFEVRDEDEPIVLFSAERSPWYQWLVLRPLLTVHRVPATGNHENQPRNEKDQEMTEPESEPTGSMTVQSFSSAFFFDVGGTKLSMQRAGWLSGHFKVQGPGIDWVWESSPTSTSDCTLKGPQSEELARLESVAVSQEKLARFTISAILPPDMMDAVIVCGLGRLESLCWSESPNRHGLRSAPPTEIVAENEK
ncbi:hypothetical protein K4F52_003270 [Lecanicillium sp. MT-2017a]|nr:hypothetical protein K4F52_003270 [Lecanicillium sp. MT-2017a]